MVQSSNLVGPEVEVVVISRANPVSIDVPHSRYGRPLGILPPGEGSITIVSSGEDSAVISQPLSAIFGKISRVRVKRDYFKPAGPSVIGLSQDAVRPSRLLGKAGGVWIKVDFGSANIVGQVQGICETC